MGEGKCASLLDWIIPGITFLRASLIIHSFSFCIIGIGMMLLVLHHKEMNQLLDSVPEMADAAACILLVIGTFIIITSTAACMCAAKSQTVLLCLYGGSLMCIAIIELGLVISLVSNRDVLLANLDKGLNQTLINYQSNSKIHGGVDFLQSLMTCCGVYNYTDWKYFELSEIPKSCCYIDISQCITTNPEHLHSQGCLLALQDLFKEHHNVILIGVLAVCLHPVVGSLIAYSLVYRIKKKYYVL